MCTSTNSSIGQAIRGGKIKVRKLGWPPQLLGMCGQKWSLSSKQLPAATCPYEHRRDMRVQHFARLLPSFVSSILVTPTDKVERSWRDGALWINLFFLSSLPAMLSVLPCHAHFGSNQDLTQMPRNIVPAKPSSRNPESSSS